MSNSLDLSSPPINLLPNTQVKQLCRGISLDPAKVDHQPIVIRGFEACYHDTYHLELSCLDRISIAGAPVSGIHGFYHPIFHDAPIEPEYDGLLDDVRLLFHEWLTRFSAYNTVKVFFIWIPWLLWKGIDPFELIRCHLKSLQAYPPPPPERSPEQYNRGIRWLFPFILGTRYRPYLIGEGVVSFDPIRGYLQVDPAWLHRRLSQVGSVAPPHS